MKTVVWCGTLALTLLTAVGFSAAQTQAPPPAQPGANAAPPAATATTPYMRRSIVHHYPYPYPDYYANDQRGGFRNPGGAGRYAEYYPPGNRFQVTGDPVRVARFDQGGGPDRAEQLASQQIGLQREANIMNHIDNYARPAFGVGFFGGFY